jgi:chromosome segregation ATPase
MGVFNKLYPWYPYIETRLARIESKLDQNSRDLQQVLTMEKSAMAALTDLQSALTDLAASVASGNAEIETLLGKIVNPGTSDADIEAAVASIRSIIASQNAEVAKAQAAAP